MVWYQAKLFRGEDTAGCNKGNGVILPQCRVNPVLVGQYELGPHLLSTFLHVGDLVPGYSFACLASSLWQHHLNLTPPPCYLWHYQGHIRLIPKAISLFLDVLKQHCPICHGPAFQRHAHMHPCPRGFFLARTGVLLGQACSCCSGAEGGRRLMGLSVGYVFVDLICNQCNQMRTNTPVAFSLSLHPPVGDVAFTYHVSSG